ncbi:complex I assembly factor TIMMDC1, mitochondrial [Melanotaenia boesemani]|uniref:complex I assembly factor TIMMDC1, mitochondrial n=1 Tax=Melanotaenia boesemani TaxID=1250792 RepID=UPI001C03BFEF|nr:complex I assembly factor TIMMDC1, mitochondrial [Melanotaenia boesemani]XP_041834843.1 complex I assembly factor TIMMDC1, mitochondrial [Melanotaenia boesemani]
MHLERDRTSSALHRLQADSVPPDMMSTGLLQGLLQTARPRFFYFLLPRVYADDVAAAQMPSSSTSPNPVPVPQLSTLPRNIGKPEFPDTGWERIKELFNRDETQKYPEELTAVIKCGFIGAIVGFIYGGLPAARFARQRYIQTSQAEMYTSRVEAVRSAHNAAIRGFIRYGWRWSWRVSLIVTAFSSVSTGLSVYRDKDALSHYVAAGAVTVGLFRLNLGLRGLVAGTVIGAVLGIPVGASVIGLQALAGETVRERRRRQRRELYEHKLAEWTARLQMTDDLISNLKVSSQAAETSKDMQRIQELLSLPPNEDKDSSSR